MIKETGSTRHTHMYIWEQFGNAQLNYFFFPFSIHCYIQIVAGVVTGTQNIDTVPSCVSFRAVRTQISLFQKQ